MTVRSKFPHIWSRTSRVWLLIATIALIATACGGSVESLTGGETDASDAVFDIAVEVEDAMEDEAEAMEDEEAASFTETAADGQPVRQSSLISAAGGDDSDDSGDSARPDRDAEETAAQQDPSPADGDDAEQLGASNSSTPAQAPTDLGRDIIFTAAVTIEVDDVATTGRQATEAISDLGGFVFGEESTGGAQPTTTLIFKVRPNDFSAALDALGGIGELRSQRITTDDVTERVVDLQSRIDTTRLGVERLRSAMEGATNLEDFARLEEQLLNRESDLEVLRGTLRTLRDQIDLATITLTIVQDQVRNGIEVNTSRYEGHDAGVGCPGRDGNPIEPGDQVTVCFELVNDGDQTLTNVVLTDSVLDIDADDLTVVFGDADDLQPGQALMLAYDLTAERSISMRVTVTATPTNGASPDAAGPEVRTTLTPRISVDQSAVTAGFGDGFSAATTLLSRLWVFVQVLVGFILPLLVLLPFAWLAVLGLRRLRRDRDEAELDESGFEEMPPPPNVASA